MRLDKAEDCSIQQHMDTSSKYVKLVQFETRSRERIAILSNTVACNRPQQHTSSCSHRESGMHEDKRMSFTKRYALLQECQVLQYQREQDARKSFDQPGGSKSSWETGSN